MSARKSLDKWAYRHQFDTISPLPAEQGNTLSSNFKSLTERKNSDFSALLIQKHLPVSMSGRHRIETGIKSIY